MERKVRGKRRMPLVGVAMIPAGLILDNTIPLLAALTVLLLAPIAAGFVMWVRIAVEQ